MCRCSCFLMRICNQVGKLWVLNLLSRAIDTMLFADRLPAVRVSSLRWLNLST